MFGCRLLLAVFAALLAGPAPAKSPVAEILCEPTGVMYDRLARRMGGTRTATGIRDREQIMEVWTDRQGDWTLVATYASGTSCIVAIGEAWQNLTPHDPKDRASNAGEPNAGDPEG